MKEQPDTDDVIDVEALEPIKRSSLIGPPVDGVTALAELSEAEFSDKLADLVRGRDRIALIKRTLMVEDVHFGTIPGTPKATLYQPGAQLLCMVFGLRATFEQVVEYGDGTNEPAVRCRTTCSLHLGDTSGPTIATGNGAASTWERKHRYRRGDRACPSCGVLGSIIRGKSEFGGGFVCWKKKDGCGAKFKKNDRAILDQQIGDVENDDQADLENTVIKMAEKRSYIGAVLRGTASSDLFTQDTDHGDGPGDDGGRPGQDEQPPLEQPRAINDGNGGTPAPAPGDGAHVAELHQARAMFVDGDHITTSQQGRLYNLAGKNGWSNEGVDGEIARVLSIETNAIPKLGDSYAAIVAWFQSHAPSSG